MSDINNYVVYAYISEKTGLFYYIGKGRPRRPYVSSGRRVPVPCKSHIVILKKDLDEETAYNYEKKYIAFYGRKDLGEGWCTLENKTNGGSGFSGVRHSKEWREKKSRMSRGKNHYNYHPYNWFHPVCGEVKNVTAAELHRMYPEQNLVVDHLRKVTYKQKRKYKGWIIPEHVGEWEKKDLYQRKPVCSIPGCNTTGKLNPVNWFHPVCGEILGKTPGELIKLFPEQSLRRESLRKMANGKKQSYKGWRILENKILPWTCSPPIVRDWYHPEKGVFLGRTLSDIKKMFPEMEIKIQSLRRVAKGLDRSYKGWTLASPL